MRCLTILPFVAFVLAAGCGDSKPASAPASAPSAATAAPTETTAPPSSAVASSSAAPAKTSAPPPAPPPPKTFAHSKLGFEFSYPAFLNVKEDAKGATLESKPIAKVEDRSGKSKAPVDVSLVVKITVEDGAIPAVAKKTNPSFADSFPKGSEKDFKEKADFASKVTVPSGTAYRFEMGSHGSNEQDTFVPGKNGKTLLVRCSWTSDSLEPTICAQEQLDMCEKIVTTLTVK